MAAVDRPGLDLCSIDLLLLDPSDLAERGPHLLAHATVHLHTLQRGVVHTVEVGGLEQGEAVRMGRVGRVERVGRVGRVVEYSHLNSTFKLANHQLTRAVED